MMKNERSNRWQERVKKTERRKKRKKEANRKREINKKLKKIEKKKKEKKEEKMAKYKYSKLGRLNITSSQAICARKDISRIEQIGINEWEGQNKERIPMDLSFH